MQYAQSHKEAVAVSAFAEQRSKVPKLPVILYEGCMRGNSLANLLEGRQGLEQSITLHHHHHHHPAGDNGSSRGDGGAPLPSLVIPFHLFKRWTMSSPDIDSVEQPVSEQKQHSTRLVDEDEGKEDKIDIKEVVQQKNPVSTQKNRFSVS